MTEKRLKVEYISNPCGDGPESLVDTQLNRWADWDRGKDVAGLFMDIINELHERIEKLEAYLRPVDLHLDSDLERAIWDILGGKPTIGVGETVEKPKEKP